jgi:hypothetical protein
MSPPDNEAKPPLDETSPTSPLPRVQVTEEAKIYNLTHGLPSDAIAHDIKLNATHRGAVLANLINEAETKMTLAQSVLSSAASRASFASCNSPKTISL